MARAKGAKDTNHAEKRRELLAKVGARLLQGGRPRPSVRQLANASGVSVSTLAHYFDDRDSMVAEVLKYYRFRGQPFMTILATTPDEGLEASVRDFLNAFMSVLQRVQVGDILALGLAEGLFHPQLGQACVREILDPAVDALAARLTGHLKRGEMTGVDPRHGALILLSPLMLASLHQHQLHGADISAVDLGALIDTQARGFSAAYSRR